MISIDISSTKLSTSDFEILWGDMTHIEMSRNHKLLTQLPALSHWAMGGTLSCSLEVALLISNHWAGAQAVSVPSHQPGELATWSKKNDFRPEVHWTSILVTSLVHYSPFILYFLSIRKGSLAFSLSFSMELRIVHPGKIYWHIAKCGLH